MRNSFLLVALGLFLMLGLRSAALAQEDEEIIVTGSRLAAYDRLVVPQVWMVRRADFAVVDVEIRCDTRDESQRLAELRQALRGLQERSRPDAVTLALRDEDNEIVRAFSIAAADDLYQRGPRADTTRLTVLLRTPIAANDTLETVRARIDRFLAAAPKPGRVEMEAEDLALSMVNPNQYRRQLLTAVIEDARVVSRSFGADYAPSVGGLESQVAWKRTGDLDLTLFLPYTIVAVPAR